MTSFAPLKPVLDRLLLAPFPVLAGACKNMKCPSLIVDGYEDPVHLLVRMGKTVLVPSLIGEIKEDSSKWIKT